MDAQLFSLLRAFFALTSPNALQFPESCSLLTINNFLVQNILLSEHFLAYPPSDQYQQRFWKWVIETLEDRARKCPDADFEIDAQIYTHYVSLMPPSGPATGSSNPSTRSQICGRGLPGRATPAQSYITHFWDPRNLSLDPAIRNNTVDVTHYQTTTLLESRTMIENGTTGLRTWMASFVLSQYIILHPDIVVSKRVLELGSGIGFLGIIVATLQNIHQKMEMSSPHPSLCLTDINNEVLARCSDNINLSCNASSNHHNIDYMILDWSESIDPEQCSPLETLIHEKIHPDVILGADVVFDPSLIPSLVGTIMVALQPTESQKKPIVALIALTVRNETTINKFIARVEESLLTIHEVDIGFKQTSFSETVETHNSCENVKLFRIRRAA
ncbi:hypothetical protein CVT25_002923 [Psilocybe cyanescens]|uniref:FAM86 N-terminal domain-containing protein n=1 Tax=Psilocybe cyanescens TaxID=93625 RepID=A0A409WMY3_PSICY|nr:hypothetical protein CVT25_002923 [Psilocybe cyanescens]